MRPKAWWVWLRLPAAALLYLLAGVTLFTSEAIEGRLIAGGILISLMGVLWGYVREMQ